MDSKLHPDMDAQKRRTTRIVQAVPLTVTGVDALGRPFQERTSTLIINSHGCRYQSKHYVLKNMWVTLEIPHNEAGREPRSVRARVTWIQRPRTVRELFQIGVELEVPGNVWGIAFPPGDWFPFPEPTPKLEIPAPAETAEPPATESEWVTPKLSVPAEPAAPVAERAEAAESAPESNIRVLPSPASTDASMIVARQVARMVMEAKQQLQGTVRETATKAVAEETRPLIAALQSQMKDAAEKSVAAAVEAYIERAQSERKQGLQKEMEANVASMRAEWAREFDQRIAEARVQIDSQISEVERSRRANFENQIQNQVQLEIEKIKNLSGNMGPDAGEVRTTIEQLRQASAEAAANETLRWQDQAQQRTSEAQMHLAHLEQVAKRLEGQISDVTTMAESRWRQLLEADLTAASAQWREKIEVSIDDAARAAADRLARKSETSVQLAELQLQQRLANVGSSFSQMTAEAEAIIGTVRAAINVEGDRGKSSIDQMQQSVSQLEAKREELNSQLQKSLDDWAQRSQEAAEAHGIEINRRAEAAVSGMAERLQPLLEASGYDTIERLARELSEKLSPEIARATEVMGKLSLARNLSDETLAEHKDRVWQISDRSVQDSVVRTKELHAQVEKEFAESGRAMSAKWISDLEAKATETTHATFEALFKSAEWYEKKVQTQMQSTLERGLDQASSSLREKAAELSGLFASELDHYSRSFVEHAQSQIQDNARDAAEHAKELMAEAGEKVSAEFAERTNHLGREQLALYATKADAAFEQTSGRMELHTAQVRDKLESDTRNFAAEYQRALSQHTQQSLTKTKDELATQIDLAKDSLRLETQSMDRQFRTAMQSLSAHAMDEHKQRLENASSSWLLTTVTKLNQQSEEMIDQLAAATEKKLKSVCGNVFAEMGETLRQRLAGFSDPFTSSVTSTVSRPNPFNAPASSEKKSEDQK